MVGAHSDIWGSLLQRLGPLVMSRFQKPRVDAGSRCVVVYYWNRTLVNSNTMGFSQPKGIFQQIADQMRDRILAGEWHEGERIPSVRELAVGVGVNPNTVTKSYQALLDRGIIENQRGLGYFVAADAKRRVVDQIREEFVRDELPRIVRTMRVLNMNLIDLEPYFARLNAARTP